MRKGRSGMRRTRMVVFNALDKMFMRGGSNEEVAVQGGVQHIQI